MEKSDRKLTDLAATGRMLGGWVLKGGLSILDLVFYSGSMFLVSVLLARWMSVESYGIFALAMVITTLFYQVQNSLILEPMSVIGPSKSSHTLPQYLSRQRIFHFVLFLFLGFSIIFISLIYREVGGAAQVFTTMILLGLLAGLMQLPWMIRRSFYVLGQPFSAVLYSLVFALVTVGGLYLLNQNKWLSTETTLVLLAVSGLIAVVFIYTRLHLQPAEKVRFDGRVLWEENWGFGKWILLTGIVYLIAGQAPIVLAAIMLGPEASGVIKAMQNFMLPMGMVISTLVALTIPQLAVIKGKGMNQSVTIRENQLMMFLLINSGIYALILMIFATPLEAIIYQGKYSGYAYLIPIWGWMPFMMALASAPSIHLRLNRMTNKIFQTSIVWMVVTLVMCITLTSIWGVFGLTVGCLIGYLASALAYYFVSWRSNQDQV